MSLLNTSTSHSRTTKGSSSFSRPSTMPLSRLFSRRRNNSKDSSDQQSRSDSGFSNMFSGDSKTQAPRSEEEDSPPVYSSSPAPGSSNSPSGQYNPSAGPSNTTNPNLFVSRFRPFRPAPSPPQAGPSAPPSYVDPMAETKDDPYAFLAKFDTMFLIDDSGSMAGSRWRQTEAALAAILPVCTEHDKDGVDVYFLNHSMAYPNLTTPAAVTEAFSWAKPWGGTPTGTRLHQLLKPYLENVKRGMKRNEEVKPLNVIVITDGQASDDVETVVMNAAKKLHECDAPPWQLGIQFFQVGNDPGATRALKELDDELEEMGCPRDIVDTVPFDAKGMGDLSMENILKIVLGSVTRRLDRRDVRGKVERK